MKELVANTLLVHTRGKFSEIAETIPDSITHLRPLGGSAGMWTFFEDKLPPEADTNSTLKQKLGVLTDEIITEYCDFIETTGKRTIYMLNTNDTEENALWILQKFIDQGANIDAVEIGQELYLPKFEEVNGPIAQGYVRQVLWSDYASYCLSIIPKIKQALPNAKILLHIGYENGAAKRTQWNNNVESAISAYPNMVDGLVVHIYEGGNNLGTTNEEVTVLEANYSQFDKWDLPLYFTETGHKKVDYTDEGKERYRDFYKRLNKYCEERNDGSMPGVHLLYLRNGGLSLPGYGALYNSQGPTPLLDEIAGFPWTNKLTRPSENETTPEPEKPVLIKIENKISFFGRQVLRFSDGSWSMTKWMLSKNQLREPEDLNTPKEDLLNILR